MYTFVDMNEYEIIYEKWLQVPLWVRYIDFVNLGFYQ